MAEHTPVLAENLARALSSLTRRMTYPSESDYPFEPFWADMRPGEALTAESFRTAARIGRRYEITFRPMWQEARTGKAHEELTEL